LTSLRVGGALIVLLLGASGCTRSNPARDEASRVLGEIDRIGRTPAAERPPLLEALAQRELTEAQVREVRDVCVEAYRRLAEAKASADAATEVKGDPSDPAVRLEMTKRLLAAEESQLAATERHQACRRALGALRAQVAH